MPRPLRSSPRELPKFLSTVCRFTLKFVPQKLISFIHYFILAFSILALLRLAFLAPATAAPSWASRDWVMTQMDITARLNSLAYQDGSRPKKTEAENR